MLAAPASRAAPPRAKSRASCGPAVPPPPVLGAAVGSGVTDGLGVAGGGVCDAVAAVLAGELAGELWLVLAELAAVAWEETDDVGEADLAGENEVRTGDGVDAVQAETAAETSMTMVLQAMTASPAAARFPALVVRTFIEPPHAGRSRPGRRGQRTAQVAMARSP